MYPKLITLRSARTPQLGRLTTLLVLAIATAGLTGCSESSGPTAAPDATTPDLQFEPSALTLTPGDTGRTTVRVENGADCAGRPWSSWQTTSRFAAVRYSAGTSVFCSAA